MSKLRVPANGKLVLPGHLRRRPKVALGTPYGGSVTAPFYEAVLALQVHELSKAEPLLQYRLPKQGLYVDQNRNEIAARFWERTDADWLLQVDSDISFPPTLVETMVELAGKDKKVLAASVPLGPPLPSCGLLYTDVPGIWRFLEPEELTREGVEVQGLATAVMMAHREVFDAVADKFGQCWFLTAPPIPRLDDDRSRAAWASEDGPLRDRKFIAKGEDLSFCIRAAEVGFAIWCAYVPGLKHFKALPLSHDYELREGAVDVQAQQRPVQAEGGAA